MHPRTIRIQDYTYNLPDERIAKFPLDQRDASKLLIYKDGRISDSVFSQIAAQLPEGALLVFNNTRVIHARILFRRQTGAAIEVFCLEPDSHHDYPLAFSSTGTCTWNCMVGNAKRWKKGEVLTMKIEREREREREGEGEIVLHAELIGRKNDSFLVKFTWQPEQLHFAEVLHVAGILPLPPYLNRENTEADEDRYQTIYAKEEGSVAAPTAGLHFTDAVMERLRQKNINRVEVTLHVGAGTFRPVKSENMEGHEMHEETVMVSLETLRQLKGQLESGKPLIAVGTTVTRTLESLYHHGVKLLNKTAGSEMEISQWEVYDAETSVKPADAIEAIIHSLEKGGRDFIGGTTRIMIAPGYAFRMVDILITNFHQPENTLMLLVATFLGDDWKRVYAYALTHDFRFLSYGDSSVLYRDRNRTQETSN